MSSPPFKSSSQSPLHNFSISEPNWSTSQQPGQRITEPSSPQLEENRDSARSALQEHDQGEHKEQERKTWNLRPRKAKTPVSHQDYCQVKWPKISIALTQKEIDEDFIAMTGSRPVRKLGRKPKASQEILNKYFPGKCLESRTPDDYNVSEEFNRYD